MLLVLVGSVALAGAVYMLYKTCMELKAEKLYREYFDTLDTVTLTTPCYGYFRVKESECFAWTSQSGEQVCGIRNRKTGEEQIYYNGTCFFYESLESEPKLSKSVIPYEETINQITKMINLFSEEMVLSPSLYHRTFLGDESLPFFWKSDSQLLELSLADQANSFIADKDSWADIVLYPNGSSLFTYNLTPFDSTNDNESIFLAIGRQECELTNLYGWQGHILPEWKEIATTTSSD